MIGQQDTRAPGIPTQTDPPRVGDKVVYAGTSRHPVWHTRRTQVGIVVTAAASAEFYTWVYSPGERDTWQAVPAALRVVERATYTPVGDESAVDDA